MVSSDQPQGHWPFPVSEREQREELLGKAWEVIGVLWEMDIAPT